MKIPIGKRGGKARKNEEGVPKLNADRVLKLSLMFTR